MTRHWQVVTLLLEGLLPQADLYYRKSRKVDWNFHEYFSDEERFDLARRVHRETMNISTMPSLLSRLLTQAEKEKLGL